MFSFRALAVLCCAASAVRAFAQTEITESEFVDRVTDEHPAWRALGGDVAAAEAGRRRAGLLANPRAEFEREHPEDNPRQDTWSVAWTPPLPGKYLLGRQAADAAVRAERFRLHAERLRVRQEARRVYADWSLAEARRALLAAQAQQLASLADKARLRAESGEESGLSSRRLRLAAAEVRAALATADAERERAAAEARAWRADLAPDAQPVLPVLPEALSPPAGLSTLESRALEADLEHARLTRRVARRFWEAPELMVGRQTLSDVGPPRTGTVWGVSWSVPLFERGQPERALAARKAEIAEARLEMASRRSRTQIEAAAAAYRALLEGVRAIEPDVRAPEGILDAAIASYRAGESSVTDLLDTLEGVRSASLRWLDLYAEAHSAHRALELALGQPEGDQK
jgi:outer membrane protein TolC